jgi:hypothetical protein
MNPLEQIIYNTLNDERDNLITNLPNMHKEAKRDALRTIKTVTAFMRHLHNSDICLKCGASSGHYPSCPDYPDLKEGRPC